MHVQSSAHKKQRLQLKNYKVEHLGSTVVEHLPSTQGVILESRMESRIRLPAWSLLLPLLCLSHE